MYLQITTKCSMACAHCCYGCNTTSGEHMSMTVFRRSLRIMDDYVTIGGGEPTLHPHFREILIETIAAIDGQLSIITNGSVKKNALLLAKLAKRGVIWAALSTDHYHDESIVSEEVYEAFGRLEKTQPGAIRNLDESRAGVCGQGSAVKNGLALPGRYSDYNFADASFACACETVHIRTDGRLTWCGCADAPTIGHVDEGWPDEMPSGCWHNAEREGCGHMLKPILARPENALHRKVKMNEWKKY